MASVLVYIQLEKGQPTQASLGALTYARQVGTERGAIVYAFVPLARHPNYADDDLCAVLSRYGVDKVLLAADESLDGPARPDKHGLILQRTCERYRVGLVIFADNGADNGADDGADDGAAATLVTTVAEQLGAKVLKQDPSVMLPAQSSAVVRLLRPPAPKIVSTDEAEVIPLTIA